MKKLFLLLFLFTLAFQASAQNREPRPAELRRLVGVTNNIVTELNKKLFKDLVTVTTATYTTNATISTNMVVIISSNAGETNQLSFPDPSASNKGRIYYLFNTGTTAALLATAGSDSVETTDAYGTYASTVHLTNGVSAIIVYETTNLLVAPFKL